MKKTTAFLIFSISCVFASGGYAGFKAGQYLATQDAQKKAISLGNGQYDPETAEFKDISHKAPKPPTISNDQKKTAQEAEAAAARANAGKNKEGK